jgi:predicted dehydrogenase
MHANTLGSTFFLGDKGGMKLNPLEIYRDEAGYMVDIIPHLPKRLGRYNIPPSFHGGATLWDDTNRAKITAFVEAIRQGKPSPIDPAPVVLEHYVLDAIYKSASLKREINVELPKELFK